LFFIKTFQKLKKISAKIRSDAFLLYLCFKDIRTPRSAKIISLIALGLAFSPIDLIPDFIPVLGYLDDIIIIPMLIYIAFRLIPGDIISENRSLAEKPGTNKHPVFKAAGFIIIVLWLPGIVLIGYKISKYLKII
jgi:uncharacterized membrane protein YkvA (DUF1232 family)